MKRFKEFLAEAGLKKALKTKKQKLLKKEEQKAEARWERTMDRAMSADVAGAMQEYGASSPEAGRAKLKSDLAHESAGKLASNIEKLKKARKESNVSENYDPYLDLISKKIKEKRQFDLEKFSDFLPTANQANLQSSLPGMDLTAELGQTPEQIDAINDPTRGGQTGIFGKPGNTGSNQKPNTPPQIPYKPYESPFKPYDKNKGREPCGCCDGEGRVYVPERWRRGPLSKDAFETCHCCRGSGLKKDALSNFKKTMWDNE